MMLQRPQNMHEQSLSRAGVPALIFVVVSALVALTWWWLGKPVPMPAAAAAGDKLQCVSYAPFRGEQSPLSAGTFIQAAQIEDDLIRLKQLTDCIRTYSTEHGLDQVPAIAQRVGLKVIQGLWLSSQPEKNRQQVESVVALAKRFPDVIQSVVVGNEVLLRGELSGADVANFIREVKKQVSMPVTYADVWEFWLRHREVYDAVDFVTIHILPYWEDYPIAARDAAAHVGAIREKMAAAFPNKDILIGETGWPSQGRMREGALPSLVNEALILQEILALAKQRGYRVNVIEAFDQPWKRRLEGTVGGYWGLFDDATRQPKFQWGAPVSNHPHWLSQAGFGVAFVALIFAAAAWTRRPDAGAGIAAMPWLAVAIIALAGGTMLGLAVEKTVYESLGLGGWLRSGALVALAAFVPIAAASTVMRQTIVPSFADSLARGEATKATRPDIVTGLLIVAVTVLAIQVALGLVFDPRYRDFTYAPLTAAIVPVAVLALFSRWNAAGPAETIAACVLLLSAIYIVFNEGFANWQSLWFCALLTVLALSLLLRRSVPAAQS
jgi:exo-beta-1,3-glucanase (GH17 family)